ncbi:MAG: hypothetical protein COB67_13660 [SAR324 cluster bacterium]|uniref:Signal transduction histidine-protein kinase/phosphatase MprB n=1 Tax=SAR324 cluster bacterium TaxID=2024889 RepID=A0A2A4SLR7_9DELT|nr:MAG: hypothetical protein COB67_13660 [SAR324 cluster bacterium]
MAHKLSLKIVLSFILTALVTLLLMAWVLQVQLNTHFDSYRLQEQQARLQEAAVIWEEIYVEQGGWEPIRNNPRAWFKGWRQVERQIPGHWRKQKMHQRMHPEGSTNFFPRGNYPGSPPKPLKVSLLDRFKNRIAGPWVPEQGSLIQPLVVDGQEVGFLAIRQPKNIMDSPGGRFLARQVRMLYVISGIAFLFAAFVSWLLTRYFLAPVPLITQGTQAIIQRKFDTRIHVKTNDELGQLARHFNEMAETLGSFEQQRKHWLSDIAHELRTPLSVLQGEMEAILDGIRPCDHHQIEQLHKEVMYLEKLVEDLRELSLADSGELTFHWEELNPFEILNTTYHSFQGETELQQLKVELQLETSNPIIKGDAKRLRQLFSNLLSNTLKYAAPGKLRITGKIGPEFVLISFLDSGPGVPEEDVEKLFERLFRVDRSRSRAQGGTGLGLAICQAIVTKHSGTIQATNRVEGGLNVAVRLPLTSSHTSENKS